jgi:hypothetical protein
VFTTGGWFWHTDSPWGALVFHYGRWSLDPSLGWIWVPGYNWGPSWVAWRHAEGYYGWAPLPPAAVFRAGFGLRFNGVAVGANIDFGLRADCFTFVGCDNIFSHDYRAVWVPREQVSVVFAGSVVRNSYHVEHGRFVVEGFGREHIIQHSNIKVVNVVSVSEQVRAQNVTVVKNITNSRNQTNTKNVTNVKNVSNEKSVSTTRSAGATSAKPHAATEPAAHPAGATTGAHPASSAETKGTVGAKHPTSSATSHPSTATAGNNSTVHAAAPSAATGASATPHSAPVAATHHSSTPAGHTTTPAAASHATTHSAANSEGHSTPSSTTKPAGKTTATSSEKSTAKTATKPAAKPSGETKSP